MQNDVAALKATVTNLRAKQAPAKREGDPVLNELRDREVRDYIERQTAGDSLKIQALYAGTNAPDIIAAIEPAPKALDMVPQSVIEQHAQPGSGRLIPTLLRGLTRPSLWTRSSAVLE